MKATKSNKIIKFKKTLDEISVRANKKCDDGDYAAALNSLFYYASRRNFSADVYGQIADIYAEMGLFDRAINSWYKFLSHSPEEYYADGYNGLGANYYFKGDKERANYYFDRQFAYPDAENCVYNDVLDEFVNEGVENDSDDFKAQYYVAYSADGKDKFDDALNNAKMCNEHGDYANAVKYAENASEYDDLRGDALYELAYAEFSTQNLSLAVRDIAESLKILDTKADVKHVLLAAYIFSAVSEEPQKDEALSKLEDLAAESSEGRVMQIASLYEFGRVDTAESKLKKYINEFPYESGLIYLKGVMEYNSGDYSAALNSFSSGYAYTESSVFLYYREITYKAINDDIEIKRLNPVFELPDNEIESRMGILLKLFRREIKPSDLGISISRKYFDWAVETGNDSLQTAVGLICCRSGETYRKYLALKLTDINLSDEMKRKYVTMLCEFLYGGYVDIVYDGYYKKIRVEMPMFDDYNFELFSAAYSYAVGLSCMLFDTDYDKLSDGAIRLQQKIISSDETCKIGNVNALACAIAIYSSAFSTNERANKLLYDFFGTKKSDVDEILNMKPRNNVREEAKND